MVHDPRSWFFAFLGYKILLRGCLLEAQGVWSEMLLCVC